MKVRDRDRLFYLHRLYVETGGSTTPMAPASTIGEALGWDLEETELVVEYLTNEGLIRLVTFGPNISLTHAGVRRVERAIDSHEVPAAPLAVASTSVARVTDEDRDEHPTAFISWAHQAASWSSERASQWERQIAELTIALRRSGIAADSDLFHLNDQDIDWTRWGPQRIASCDFVLIALSSAYKERWEGSNKSSEGAGAVQEADAIHGLFQRDQADFQKRVKILMLDEATEADVPDDLHRLHRFHIEQLSLSDGGFGDLIRTLTNQPKYEFSEIGRIPILPPEDLLNGKQVAFQPAARRNLEAEVARLAEARLELLKGLKALPDEDLAEGAHLPWFRERQRIYQQLASVDGALKALLPETDP